MKYKMVVFDLDGTILNTIGDLCDACNYALKKHGLTAITEEQTKAYLGHGIRHLIQEASLHHPQVDDILADFKAYYGKNYNIKTKAYSGIQEVFSYCREQGIRLGVVTNKVESIARHLVEAHFPNIMNFVYGDTENRKRKPNPETILTILKDYALNEEDLLYIGDSEVDIATVSNAGVNGLFVSYGFRAKQELQQYTDRLVDCPNEIIEWIR